MDYVSDEVFESMVDCTRHIKDSVQFFEIEKPKVIAKVEYEHWDEYADDLDMFLDISQEDYPVFYEYLHTDNKADHYFMELIAHGFIKKYQEDWDTEVYYKRLEEEFWTLKQVGDKIEQPMANYFITMSKILMEEAIDKKKVLTEEELDDDHKKTFEIKKDTPQFGDVRTSQEETLRKTINDNIKFESNALKYYPDADDMTLDGKIPSLNLTFQFRYSDPSGDGVYVWCDATQLTESNARTFGKIRDAFGNWKDSITQDGDLMEKLKKASKNQD
jgi:hypothetical protein